RNASLLRRLARKRAGRVHERDDREAELDSLPGHSQRFAKALWVHHPPVPRNPVGQVAPLLLTDEDGRETVPGADPGDHRRVVVRDTVAVQLDEVWSQPLDVVE